MKILELRFKNLNSLYGEWFIDFTVPEYVSNGIFALTGPTGAGKSTILDAICLALYGATPRLNKITKNSNEIMSRRTGECYAEVVFESQAGRFRCHWSQHRARKKVDGNLTDSRHEIAHAHSGKIIESKKRDVTRVIEEKTGMDFERFTRSVLLAQGGFDTFLKADAEQKSRILEQITGTGIYSEISRRVHERHRDEREKLNVLEAETSGMLIFEPEQEKEIQQDLDVRQKEDVRVSGELAETGKAIEWLTFIDGLKKEITSLAGEAIRLQNDFEAFKPERNKLDRAIRAASLAGSYATLTAIRDQQADDNSSLKIEETAISKLKYSAGEQADLLRSVEQQTVKTKNELKIAAPLIQKIRFLDQKFTRQKNAVSDGEKSCKKDAMEIETYKRTLLEEQRKAIGFEETLTFANDYLKVHAQDEWLISGLAGVKEQFGNLLSRQKEIAQKETGLKKADTVLQQAIKKLYNSTEQCGIRRHELEDVSGKLQLGRNALSELLGEQLLREYRTEKETLLREMAFLSKRAELEDRLAKLEDGKPCPLCGALEHPFALGNIPVPDEIEKKIGVLTALITRAENQEAANKKLEEVETSIREKLTDSEKVEAAAVTHRTASQKTLRELMDGLEKLRAGFIELGKSVSVKLQPLGITEIPDDGVLALLESLEIRLKTWLGQVKEKTEIEKTIAGVDGEMKRLDGVIVIQSTALAQKQEHLKTLKNEYAIGRHERSELYGDKNTDYEESRLSKAVADCEEAEKKVRTLNTDLQQELSNAKTRMETHKKRINRRDPELKRTEIDFSSALAPAGFSDEKQFLEARLTAEQRETLSAGAKKLDDNQTKIKARQKDREMRLATEVARKVTDIPLEALESAKTDLENGLKQLRDTIAEQKHKLIENALAAKRVKEKHHSIQAQKKECARWGKLYSLVGSADGKKYRNFAQGITFELMVAHANRQLVGMTDRYLLIRDDGQPLELSVVDNYQAGEIRSTRNLSGGESFIVSLALALGLSKMASRKVRIDSLFLDEGFGTLDEDSLETALETLSSLQQDGKLIGIISHVTALKERISTQISIHPLSGGRSTIHGPGCSRIAGC